MKTIEIKTDLNVLEIPCENFRIDECYAFEVENSERAELITHLRIVMEGCEEDDFRKAMDTDDGVVIVNGKTYKTGMDGSYTLEKDGNLLYMNVHFELEDLDIDYYDVWDASEFDEFN